MVYERQNGALVPVGEGAEEALAAIERADTEAIVAHLSTGGTTLAHFLYSFPIEGREVVGISWPGALEIARLLGNIEVLPDVKVEEREGVFYGLVRVKDLIRNVTVLGAAKQSKEKVLRSGEVKPDEHAFVVAINKAQRNGILALVDQATKLRLVAEFLASKPKKALSPIPRAAYKAKPQTTNADSDQPTTEELEPPASTETVPPSSVIKLHSVTKLPPQPLPLPKRWEDLPEWVYLTFKKMPSEVWADFNITKWDSFPSVAIAIERITARYGKKEG